MKKNPLKRNNYKLTAKEILSLSNKKKSKELAKSETTPYAAPSTEKEEILQEMISNLLSQERVGVNDSFFQIGGNSLKATQLISLIYKRFDVELNLTEVFENASIKKLAEYIEGIEWNKEVVDDTKVVDKITI